MSIKIADDDYKWILKWNADTSSLNLLRFDYSTFSQTSNQYIMSLGTQSLLSYKPGYLSAYDTTTQYNLYSGNTFSYNTTVESRYITIENDTKITFQNPGLYNIQFSAQFEKTDSGDDIVQIWFSKNGTAIPWSNSSLTVQGNNGRALPSWNYLERFSENDYLEIVWYSADADMTVLQAATASGRPAIPSVILTVWELYDQKNI